MSGSTTAAGDLLLARLDENLIIGSGIYLVRRERSEARADPLQE